MSKPVTVEPWKTGLRALSANLPLDLPPNSKILSVRPVGTNAGWKCKYWCSAFRWHSRQEPADWLRVHSEQGRAASAGRGGILNRTAPVFFWLGVNTCPTRWVISWNQTIDKQFRGPSKVGSRCRMKEYPPSHWPLFIFAYLSASLMNEYSQWFSTFRSLSALTFVLKKLACSLSIIEWDWEFKFKALVLPLNWFE